MATVVAWDGVQMSESRTQVVSGTSRRIPVWTWFAVFNVVVVVAAVIGIKAYLDRDRPVVVAPLVEPTPPIQESKTPNDQAREASTKKSLAKEPEATASLLPSVPQPRTTAELVAGVQDGVVFLTTYNSKGDKLGFGTGFVIDSKGLVATNFHVLRSSSAADVEFHNRDRIKVKGVLAWDMATDLAILELANLPKGLKALELATTLERPDGTDVIAIGHPQEFKFTTTTGILSAVRKTSELPLQYRQFLGAKADDTWLQTNAVISGGSSGGPLLDRTGHVIGINTWVSGNYSFAIDVRHLAALKQSLKSESLMLADLTGPGEQLANLLAEFQQRAQWFNMQIGNAPNEAKRLELLETKHPAAEFAPRLYELAVECEHTPVAYECLDWACQIAGQQSAPATCDAVLRRIGDRLSEKYADDPRLVGLMWGMRGSPRPGAWYVMQRIGEGSSVRDARGIGLFSAGYARLASAKDGESAAASGLLEKVVEQYSDVIYHCSDPRHPEHLIASEAKELLYRINNLSVGSPAMEISGMGLDAAKFKLTDYRGKIVVLDFWEDECQYCREMWPHERKMVAELKDAPFALVGVFSGKKLSLQQLVDNGTVTWKNWVDDTGNPISTTWRIEGFPTLYILDHNGVIRYRATGLVSDAQLSKWVQDLLAKVPKPAPSAAL